ncbi:MAG: aminotransferase class V-fold PLP-dependent enzyme [Bacteroidales bacterium]|nr:aminotransferase class V-fold PLP-dependent enzyme [Bacteroidales bacterium]
MVHSPLPSPSSFASLWNLDPDVVFLNHGSFGACPHPILERQNIYRQQMEQEPVRFFIRELEPLQEQARRTLAGFTGAKTDDLVFVRNATEAVNTIFRSLRFRPGDEILITNHIYGACRRIAEYISGQTGARIREACYPFPLDDSGRITAAILQQVTPRTRIALIDHITSPTALVQPVDEIVRELDQRGIDTLIDGAHALGSIPLNLDAIGAAYYTANCHKWLCGPKSAAILHVRNDKQKEIIPLIISHAGARAELFAERFYWPATYDPSPILCPADCVGFGNSLFPGGWTEWMDRNRKLTLEARTLLCSIMGIPLPCPDNLIASMATLPLPTPDIIPDISYKRTGLFQDMLINRHHIEVPAWFWGGPPRQILRISAQLYNSMEQYRYLGEALVSNLLPGL